MNSLSEEQINRISRIVRDVEKLSDIEKLFLYLQLPCGRAEIPEGSKYKSANSNKCGDIFAKKPDQETTQTYTWILSHLEEDPNVSLPKQEVYDEYRAFCQTNRFEPLCVADFGKAMKHAFPCIKPRRLGQRGNSRYCYSGLRKKYRIDSPSIPNIINCSRIADEPHQPQQLQQLALNGRQQAHHQLVPMNCCSSNFELNSSAGAQNSLKTKISFHEHRRAHFNYDLNRRRPYEAINLKLEPVHHEQPNQATTGQPVLDQQSSGYSSGSSSDAGSHNHLGPSQTDHHHQHDILSAMASAPIQLNHSPSSMGAPNTHQPHAHPQQPLNTGQQHEHQQNHEHQNNQSYHQMQPGHRQAAAVPYINGHNHAQQQEHQPQQQQYHLLQRPGTPDDDDYRHNYQDLNMPNVSGSVPFSHSMPAQMAYIPHARTAPGAPFCDYLTPGCCATAAAAAAAVSTTQPAEHVGEPNVLAFNNQQCHSSPHQSPPSQHQSPSLLAAEATDRQQRHQQHQQQQQPPHYTGDGSSARTMQVEHHKQQSAPPPLVALQPLQQHANQLRLTSINSTELAHLCTSPFQSPASTPYPMVGSCGSAGSSSTGAAPSQQQQSQRSNTSPYLASGPSLVAQPDYFSSPAHSSIGSTLGDCMQYADA